MKRIDEQRQGGVDLEQIFAPSEYKELTTIEKGKTTQLLDKLIQEQKIKELGLDKVSTNNIKRLVGEYIASGAADEIHDPYNYADGESD